MRLLTLVVGTGFVLTMLPPLASQAALPAQSPRWVMADDVRVRTGPSSEHKVSGTLSRGAELILKNTPEVDGFCLIEGEGQFGYVACKYLSAQVVKRPRAGEGGVDAAQRWVSGNGVTLREAARPDAPVVGRMALNAIVKLLKEDAGGYCEVQQGNGPSGYTACRYLVPTPVVLANVLGYGSADQSPSLDYDPERGFWLEPSWRSLERYAEYLKERHPNIPPQGPWPRDEALERMKAHLALGVKGRKPGPYVDWMELKRKASQEMDLNGEASRLQAQGKKVPEEMRRRAERLQVAAGELQHAIGIWGPLYDTVSSEGGGAARTVRLVRSLEFSSIQPSLFRNEAELAPPGTSTEEASGRFGIVFRQVITPRPKLKSGTEEGGGPGLYDMLARTQVLVRPIQRVQLFRDGRLRAESSLVRKKETLWGDVEEPMCEGWAPGFSFGDTDASLWNYFAGEDGSLSNRQKNELVKSNGNPTGSLFAFYANINLPLETARVTETAVRMDRNATGFVQGIHLYYDLDSDGIPDLAVWEGQGKGPGHLEGPTTTDDRWYRLVLANINGAWKVLGSDAFSYGCGC